MDGHSAGPGVTDVDQPVFVDSTGQRRRVTILAGAGIGVGLLVSIGLIIAGLFGGSPVPLPGWPEANVQQQGDETNPLDTTVPTPSPAPPASDTVGPSPSPVEPSTTQPSTQTTTDRPGGGEPTHTGPGRRPSKSPGKPK